MMTRPDDVGQCCGTTCNAQATLDYIKQLEDRNADLEVQMKVLIRIHPLEIKHGPAKGDTTGTTR